MTRITGLRTVDVRFPTSAHLDGSDAMNPDPDYSAAYVILETDTGHEGHGLTFTIGRGNDICCAAIEAMRHLVVGLDMDWVAADMGRFWRHVTSDSQLRWIGPDKGAIHLATGAVVNAVWDLWAKIEGKPVWRLVADMSPEELVRCIDFRYITDCITPDEALAFLRERAAGKAERLATLMREGYPCYTTSAGWLGYGDEKLRRLCREAVDAGFRHIKLKVGRDLEDDIRRLRIAREAVGPDVNLMIDANQVWEVDQALCARGRGKYHASAPDLGALDLGWAVAEVETVDFQSPPFANQQGVGVYLAIGVGFVNFFHHQYFCGTSLEQAGDRGARA
jgi:L-fuconate dehydratase